jgi:hypothetical protein
MKVREINIHLKSKSALIKTSRKSCSSVDVVYDPLLVYFLSTQYYEFYFTKHETDTHGPL